MSIFTNATLFTHTHTHTHTHTAGIGVVTIVKEKSIITMFSSYVTTTISPSVPLLSEE